MCSCSYITVTECSMLLFIQGANELFAAAEELGFPFDSEQDAAKALQSIAGPNDTRVDRAAFIQWYVSIYIHSTFVYFFCFKHMFIRLYYFTYYVFIINIYTST